ncbi:MAG: tandem-95 repeat protein [Armatimonadetes bacterium]|nr:tandem-95 repeat protein [Akkermansiaceae bacterium]
MAWDNNPETDITAYHLRYGTTPGVYPNIVDAGPDTEVSVPDLVEGTTYYFVVSATNAAGVQSLYSNEVSYLVEPVVVPPTSVWNLHYADSQESQTFRASYAFDGDPSTFWHTAWSGNSTPPPHEIQIDLGSTQNINGFRYLPRPGTSLVGTVGQFEFYVSLDGVNWGLPVAAGTFPNNHDLKEIRFAQINCKYIRFRGLTDANGGTYMTVAELAVVQDSLPGVNQTPIATPSILTTTEDTSLNIALQGTDGDGDSLDFSVVSAPTKGTLSGTAPTMVYTPSANSNGIDSFTFRVNDGTVNSAPAAVSITVSAVNDTPLATSMSVTTIEDNPLPITVGGTDLDANTLTFAIAVAPAHGTLTGSPPNLIYSPAANFAGNDQFTFRVNDGTVDSALATVSIAVTAVNDLPTALSKSVGTTENTSLPITLAGTDAEGNPLSFNVLGLPANGTLGGTAPNLTYQPAAGFSGSDAFTFRVNDGQANSATATVSITVTPVNDAPLATSRSVTTAEDTALPIILGGTDPDANSLTYSIVAAPTHGTLSGIPPNVTYSPAANFTGADLFTFRVNDGTVNSAPATVSITVTSVNDVPLATSKSETTIEDSPLPIALAGTDPDANTLTFAIVTVPTHGLLSGTPPNLTYIPTANFTGADQFTYRVNDGTVNSAPATVSITVASVNDAPVATSKSVTTSEGTFLPITLAGFDVDGNSLTFTVLAGPENGTLGGTAPNLTYQPDSGFSGSDTFTFRVNDGQVNSATATVSITVAQAPPLTDVYLLAKTGWTLKLADSEQLPGSPGNFAFDGNPGTFWHTRMNSITAAPLPHEIQINLGTVRTINGFRYLSRQDGSTAGNIGGYEFHVSLDGVNWGSPVAAGTFASSNAEKQVLFTAKTGQFVRLKALSEINGGSVTCIAEINLLQEIVANQLPLANPQALTTERDSPLPITLGGTDLDGSALTFSIASNPLHGSLSGTVPNLTYLPNAGFTGSDQFTFRTHDGGDFSAAATVSIGVTPDIEVPENSSPFFTASLISLAATEDESFAGQLSANDADAGDVLTFQKVSGPAWLSVSTDGKLAGTPLNSDVGTISFTVSVSDPSSATATAILSITVVNSNDAPVFKTNMLVYPSGTEKKAYRYQSLAGSAGDSDAGDTITYSKVAGPSWLVVAGSGTLGGTPAGDSAGNNQFTMRATDSAGAFDEVTLQIKIHANELPLPWNMDRVGIDNTAGGASYGSGVFTITGSGLLTSAEDSGNLGWQTLSGDGHITARVSKIGNAGDATRVGVMIRESLAANSKQIYLGVDGDGDCQWLRRLNTAGSTAKSTRAGDPTSKFWVRLVRADDVIAAYHSTNGKTWTKIGKCTVSLPKNCYIGLWVSSGGDNLVSTSQFTNVVVSP